jgi:hypothetical protein
MDWNAWHKLYQSNTALQRRLELVRSQIAAALRTTPPGTVRLISVCAGDGRDVLTALADHPRARDVRARLVELDPKLVAVGRLAAEQAGLAQHVEFLQADATHPSSYDGIAPAHLVVLSGMLGLVDAAEIPRLIDCLRALTMHGGQVVWTRNMDYRNGARHSMAFRCALSGASFEPVTFKLTSWLNIFRRTPRSRFLVATHRHLADPIPLPTSHTLFRITDGDDIRVPA